MDDHKEPRNSRWAERPWWLWFVVLLFPVVLRPLWAAVISIGAFLLFVRLILGPLPTKNKN